MLERSNFGELMPMNKAACHQYMWSYIQSCPNYISWEDVDDQFIPGVTEYTTDCCMFCYSYFWETHSPWSGSVDNENDLAVLFRGDDNSRKPIAEVTRIINQNLLPNLVRTSSLVKYVKVYAGIDNEKKNSRIYLLNKDENPQKAILELTNTPAQSECFKQI